MKTAKAGVPKEKGGARERTHKTKAKDGPTKEKGGTREHPKAKAKAPMRLTTNKNTGVRWKSTTKNKKEKVD